LKNKKTNTTATATKTNLKIKPLCQHILVSIKHEDEEIITIQEEFFNFSNRANNGGKTGGFTSKPNKLLMKT